MMNEEQNNNIIPDLDFVSMEKSQFLQDNLIDNGLNDGDNLNLAENENILQCSSKMNGILQEFTNLYKEKMKRSGGSNEDELKKKIGILESWVSDLGDQNSILVTTVEDLEKEAGRRVSLLQEKLDKMAVVTRDSCVSLRDHHMQVTSLVKQKLTAEDELKDLQENVLRLENTTSSLLQQNSNLRQDLDNAEELISRGQISGTWDCTNVSFTSLRPGQFLGLEQSTSLGSLSPRNRENFPREPRSFTEITRKDSLNSSMSSDADEISIPKIKFENRNLRKLQNETNEILIQRDKHIADLQAQLTELHHRLAASQTQVDNTTSTLHSLLDRGRHDSFEITRRDNVIRQLLSPTRHIKCDSMRSLDIYDPKNKVNAEIELSENIDVMAARLSELEEECRQLRHQNAALNNSHAEYSPTIEDLKDELADSQNSLAQTKLQLRNYKQQQEQLNDEIEAKKETINLLKIKMEEKDDERKNLKNSVSSSDFKNIQTQTEHTGLDTTEISDLYFDRRKEADAAKISKIENELSEKNVLIRELQKHLVLSREELRLKDETLFNIEKKLDASRHSYDEKEERMLYLTSQLTNLQLELSRHHGNAQQLRMQLENKSELVLKLECENRSLVRQLNEKSSYYEGIQKEFSHILSDFERKKTEVSEQKLTIGTLQDALIATKITCDKLRSHFEPQDATDCRAHHSRTRPQRRNQKRRACSCRRAKSYQSQEELQILELRFIVDELSSYLKDAEQMALLVERERDFLRKKFSPEQQNYLGEFRRQRDSLNRIRDDGTTLMSKLNNMREELSKCTATEDFKARKYYFRPSSLSPAKNSKEPQEEQECQSMPYNSTTRQNTQYSSVKETERQSELNLLLSKVSNLQAELQNEKPDKDMLTGNAGADASSVQHWVNFQKVANSNLEENFQQQQKDVLSKENQTFNTKLEKKLQHFSHGLTNRAPESLPLTRTTPPQSCRHRHTGSFFNEEHGMHHKSLTNDTGIEEAPFLSSAKSFSTPGGNHISRETLF